VQARPQPRLHRVAREGAPGEPRHAEAEHGGHIDVDRAISQRGHGRVHRAGMLLQNVRGDLRAGGRARRLPAAVQAPGRSACCMAPGTGSAAGQAALGGRQNIPLRPATAHNPAPRMVTEVQLRAARAPSLRP